MDVVLITVSNNEIGKYKARSYPHVKVTLLDNGIIPFYVPVYWVIIQKQTVTQIPSSYITNKPYVTIADLAIQNPPLKRENEVERDYDTIFLRSLVWKTVRFMPYWNDEKLPIVEGYSTRGWTVAGLPYLPVTRVNVYKPNFYGGGLQLNEKGFFIHRGRQSLDTPYMGSAGCVQLFGDYNIFLCSILSLLGYKINFYKQDWIHSAMNEIVRSGRLWVEIQRAIPPNIQEPTIKDGAKTGTPKEEITID
jgi:hypothetical protein